MVDSAVNATLFNFPPITVPVSPTTVPVVAVVNLQELTTSILIQAPATNSGNVYLGGAGLTTTNGIELVAGSAMRLELSNISQILCTADATGNTLRVMGF